MNMVIRVTSDTSFKFIGVKILRSLGRERDEVGAGVEARLSSCPLVPHGNSRLNCQGFLFYKSLNEI